MFKLFAAATAMMILGATSAHAADATHPLVLELFTSQGCSSCPMADELLKEIAGSNPDVLPLSFHVHYWDYLGWTDKYSLAASTVRQKAYAYALNTRIYTPQLVVGGVVAMVGNNEPEVRAAIASASRIPPAVTVSLKPDTVNDELLASLSAANPDAPPQQVDLWEIRFDRMGKTEVTRGENAGRTLESINNVTAINPLGQWQTGSAKTIALEIPASGGVAILAQGPQQGTILGAASYVKQ